MRHPTESDVEAEVINTTREVLRSMGRIGAMTGNAHARVAAEVLMGLVEGAVAASRARRPVGAVVVHPREQRSRDLERLGE